MWKYLFLLMIVAAVIALPATAVTPDSSPNQPAKEAVGPGQPSAESVCYAEQSCDDGCPTVHCDGTSTCSVGSNYVECDGARTYCQIGCDVCYADAICGPRPSDSIHCQGTSYCNSADGCWVTCDFQTTFCPNAPAPPACPYPN